MEVVKMTEEAQVGSQGYPESTKKKKVEGIVITAPEFAGWELHRTYQKLSIRHPEKQRSLREVKGFQEALHEIIEYRIVNEITGEMSMVEYTQRENQIQEEVMRASGLQQKVQK